MKAEQLAETTLAPDTRKLLPVAFGSISEADTRTVMQTLMGERQVMGRRLWMEAMVTEQSSMFKNGPEKAVKRKK